jgi:hypothetical protein
LKQKKEGFKDTFSEGTKGQFTGHVQEVNSLLMPMTKKNIETGGIHGYLSKNSVKN